MAALYAAMLQKVKHDFAEDWSAVVRRSRRWSVDPRAAASKHPFDRRHWPRFPTDLRENPGRDESSDEDCEPDANHARNAIGARQESNRVFPSKKRSSLEKYLAPPRPAADLR